MNQTASPSLNSASNLKSTAVTATIYMVAAQAIFAVVNFAYDAMTNPWNPLLEGEKLSSSSAVFWQYLIAAIFAVPLVFRIGFGNLKTKHPILHEVRALASAIGAQVFVFGFASGVPVWQMVGLLLTGPFFVLLGSVLFLGEHLSPARVGTSIVAFCGAFLIVGFGTESFTLASLLPVLAAALWSTTTLISKYLSKDETPETLTLYLVLLISVNHAIIGLILGALVFVLPPDSLPATLTAGFDFAIPSSNAMGWVLFLGFVTALSQYFLWSAYKRADATYLQPFDDLKLPINVILAWVLLSQVPTFWFWPGATLIVGASLFIAILEHKRPQVS